MKIGNLIRFHDEHFFEGAVQLRWTLEREAQARQAAEAFVFHGPRYHGAGEAEKEGVEGDYRLKDSASFVRDLLTSLQAGLQGQEENPYWLVVAGYGSGKSHLALTSAALLGNPQGDTAASVVAHIEQADTAIGQEVRERLSRLAKPALLLTLDGTAGFHLGNALSQAVFAQLQRYGIDAGPIRDLSPRFQTAEQFVQRNFTVRRDRFEQLLPGMDAEAVCERLRRHDEEIYSQVDALYLEANGVPIPVVGQESAQELINTLCEHYCGPEGVFSSVVILFDEFGRYLEYAADKPRLAGDAALQQIFQGVQDNSNKVRFIGFVQYGLKTYLKRFSSADLRQLQRYITRFDAAEKCYLSTNLETIFAHMIGKNEADLASLWQQANAPHQWENTWRRMQGSLPGFQRLPVWNEAERFQRVIAQGCWPLHPLATWFLTRQRDVVQSRSALTFIKEIIERIAAEEALCAGRLRQVSAAELVLHSMLPEMIAAERETGATVAETLQLLLEKYQAHLNSEQRLVLAGIALLDKMRVGRQSREEMNLLLQEATALTGTALDTALSALSQDLGAIEWNRDLGQYELIVDASTRGQFQQWLRKRLQGFTPQAVRDLFVRRAVLDSELGDIPTDFGQSRNISTPDWYFEARFTHIDSVENGIRLAFKEWQEAHSPKEAKGKVIYLYLHAQDDIAAVEARLSDCLKAELERCGQSSAPIWIVALPDEQGSIAEHIARLSLFEEQMSADDQERFRRFVTDETERSRQALSEVLREAVKRRSYWVAGLESVPQGRLKSVAEAVFTQIYPKTLPFPFDGFATASGGGAQDSGFLTRHLITHQVDGHWVQAQQKKMQNRVQAILVRSWQVLDRSGRLTEPQQPEVGAVYRWLKECLSGEDSKQTLNDAYQALIAPPYGLNAASAGLLLGLLLGHDRPPRRIEYGGSMYPAGDWVAQAFPAGRDKHFLNRKVLEKTRLRFLSEDSEGRWRSLLEKWEQEQSYEKRISLAQQVQRMRKAEPLPEALEGKFLFLEGKAQEAEQKLRQVSGQLKEWERGIENAERKNEVGTLLKLASRLLEQRKTLQTDGRWPESYVEDCNTYITQIRQMVSDRIGNWIPRQSCHTAAQVSDFRQRIEKAVITLKKLAFETEAQALESQAQRSILQVEQRQKFAMTLAESDDYPRQYEPNESTPVRDLRDSITKGNELIKGIEAARGTLEDSEVDARIKAIKQRQQSLQAVLNRQIQALAQLYNLNPNTEVLLQDALAKTHRLRDIFVGTRDAEEISNLVLQLDRVLADITAWEGGDVGPERLEELLLQQIDDQLAHLKDFLEEQEIEPAWPFEAIYQDLAAERVASAERRSADWLKPRLNLADRIVTLDGETCRALEQELAAAPPTLSKRDRAQVDELRRELQRRLVELDEQARQASVKAWQRPFLELDSLESLDRYRTERLLKTLRQPPVELLPEEHARMHTLEAALTAHLDQLSMDEIIARIERLPPARQRQLLALLNERLEV